MTPETATRLCTELLAAFGLREEIGWKVRVVGYKELAEHNDGDALGRNGSKLEGLTDFGNRTIFLSANYLLKDDQAFELIAHECAHAVSGESECEDNPKFDAALKRTEQKLKEQVKQA